MLLALLLLMATPSLAKPLTRNQTCEAYAVYKESIGESVEGSLAVLTVLRNRVRIDKKSACKVVATRGQWSWYTNNRNRQSWKLPKNALTRYQKVRNMEPNLSPDVYFFHSGKSKRFWGKFCCRIGGHKFYFKEGKQ